MSPGTGAYSKNRLLKLAIPWVIDLSVVLYLLISAKGTWA
jgi:hypothetical protein